MRAVPRIHVFGSSEPTRSRPVERPDQRSRQDRRFPTSSLRQWRLPVLGLVAVPSVLLIRPDGYVARAFGDGSIDDCLAVRLAATVVPNQPRRVRGGRQHPAQRGHETPDQERRYRDELQFGNHG
jgi:hypothetical protein